MTRRVAQLDVERLEALSFEEPAQVEAIATLAGVRARPQRIVIERGGLRAEVDPGDVAALLDELRPPVDDDRAIDSAYDVVLDYGDHQERLRYDEEELPGNIREGLDARLRPSDQAS